MTEIIRADGAILAKYIGGIIKQVSENVFRGHGVRWHDQKRPDLQGEWFSQKTYFMRNAGYPVIGIPVNYQHGLHKDFGNLAIGIVNFADEDEIGLLIEGEKKTREQYIEMLKEIGRKGDMKFSDTQLSRKAELAVKAVDTLIAEVPLQFSGGFDPSTWLVDPETKHIDQAGMIHLAFTPTPADDLNPIVRFKSAIDEVLKYEPTTIYSLPNQLPVTTGGTGHTGDKGSTEAVNEAAQPHAQTIDNLLAHKGHKQMSLEEMLALLRQLEEAMTSFGQSAGASEADAVAMAEEVTDELGKADGMEEEELKALSGEKLAEKAFALFNAKLEKQRQNGNAAKAAFDKLAHNHLKAQPATQSLPAFSGGNGNGASGNLRKWGQLTVNEMREYADMSAEEMALVGKLAKSAVTPYDRKGLTMGAFVERGILSESFVKTFAHKAAAKLSTWQIKNDQDLIALNDYATMKTFNWLKADELGATDITGQGAEWVELFYDTQAWRRVREETPLYDTLVSKGMRVKDIPTGTKGMNVKLVDGAGTAYTLQEGGSVDATGRPEVVGNPSFITTNEIEANLATHIIAEGFTFQLAERSMINVAQELNEDIITTLAESLENTILNGDTRTAASTNINLIDGTPGSGLSTPDYIAWNGIRYEVLITNTSNGIDNAGASLAAVDYERVRAKFPLRFRRRKDNILFIIDEGVETQTRRLAEHFTVGIAGESAATFFTGDLNVLVGYDVYASGFLGLTNGDGKISVTAGNNVKGQIYGVFAPYWQYGRQLAINIEEDRFALSQSSVFVATVNHLLKPRSAYAAVGMYDIAVA